MITTEIKSGGATVRIHDEFMSSAPDQGRMSHLNQIVTDSYKRRIMETQIFQESSRESLMPQ